MARPNETESLYRRLRWMFYHSRVRVKNVLFPPTPIIERVPSEGEMLESFTLPAGTAQAAACADIDALVRHLRERRNARFFIGHNEIRNAVAHIDTKFPAWRDARLLQASSEAQGTISVYTETVCIRCAKDWNSIPMGPGKDILYPERPHRFDFAPSLALAALYGMDTQGSLENLLATWIEASDGTKNATGYISSHLCVYRIFALSWALSYLCAGSADPRNLVSLILRIILADARVVRARLPHTTPNNHLLADALALWYVGVLFPELAESDDWREVGESTWLTELKRQIYADGTSFEHSVHYQEHNLELAVAYMLLSRCNDIVVAPWVEQRVESMLRFQVAMAGPEANPFALGDTTEDPLFPLDSMRSWGCGAWAAIHGAIFDRGWAPADPNEATRERAFWLLGGQLDSNETWNSEESFAAFAEGGYFVFTEHASATRLIFRTGPRGDRELRSGHMHADLLSVYLSVDGHKFLTESGTFTYRSSQRDWPKDSPPWRATFFSPSASNSLVIADADPLGRLDGDFPAAPGGGVEASIVDTCYANSSGLAFAEARIDSGAVYNGHCRCVVHVVGHYWIVVDRLPAATGQVPSSLRWWLGAQIQVERQSDNSATIHAGPTQLLLRSTSGERGSKTPPVEVIQGWVSRSYGAKERTAALDQPLDGTVMHATLLCMRPGDKPTEVNVTSAGRCGAAVRIMQNEVVDTVVIGTTNGDLTESYGCAFDGNLLWLRENCGVFSELRCLDLRSLRAGGGALRVTSNHVPYTGTISNGIDDIIASPVATGLQVNHAGRKLAPGLD